MRANVGVKHCILSDNSKILDQMGSAYLVMDFNVSLDL